MNSQTGEILKFQSDKEARAAGFDIALRERTAAALLKLDPQERVEIVRDVRAACGSACPSIKDRFKRRRRR